MIPQSGDSIAHRYTWLCQILIAICIISINLPAAAGIHTCSKDTQIFISQDSVTLNEVVWDLYTSRGSSVSVSDIQSLNPSLTSGLNQGDHLCLAEPYTKSSGKTEELGGDTYWQFWQLYGTVRGYTFSEFVIHNLVTNDPVSYDKAILRAQPNFDPYFYNNLHDPVTFATTYVNTTFNQSYKDDLVSANANVLSALASKVTDERFSCIDCIFINLSLESTLDYYETDEHLDIRVVIIEKGLLDESSISLASFTAEAFEESFGSDPHATKDHDYEPVLLTIVKETVVAITYPQDNGFTSSDTTFFDRQINVGTSHLTDGKDVSFIVKDLSLELYNTKSTLTYPKPQTDTSSNTPSSVIQDEMGIPISA